MANSLIDNESYVKIDTLTRKCNFGPNFSKQIAIKGDMNANEITFVCDKKIDGFNVFRVRDIYIVWENLDGTASGKFSADERTELDGEKFSFVWLINQEVTRESGKIRFFVSFIDSNGDENNKKVFYRWSTLPSSDLYVGESVANTELDNYTTSSEVEGGSSGASADIANMMDLEDKENPIKLNMLGRDFTIEDKTNSTIAIVGDHCSNQVIFEVDAEYCDYDIAKAEIVCIKWQRGNGENAEYKYDLLTNKGANGTKYSYAWIVPNSITDKAGKFVFAICFMIPDEKGNIVSRWNSNPCSLLGIGEGVSNTKLDEMVTINAFRQEFGTISEDELEKKFEEVFGNGGIIST